MDSITERLKPAFSWLQTRATRRRIALTLVVAITIATITVIGESIVRGHLVPPEARAPSAMYTRPVPWGVTADSESDPVMIGSLSADLLEQRDPVELERIPRHLIDAVLAVEDKRFYDHGGLDLKRIVGAFIANVKAGGVTEGGSTITQQLAKNRFLTASRSPIRKVREAALATMLEVRYSKDRILQAYLNEIYLGQDGGVGIHGVGAASRFYFGKPVEKLTLAESALLAGMIRSPNRVTPTRHPENAMRRRNLVLDLMLAQHRIEMPSANRAREARLPTRTWPLVSIDARYFRDFVAKSTDTSVPERGTAIYTTLDAALQRSAERAVATGLSRLRLRGVEGAFVALDPHTGEILAMVGGRDYGRSQFNRAADAVRQPGSAFKPIVALAALEGGAGRPPSYTLASIIEDEPLQVQTSRGVWEPTDYDGSFRGLVTLRYALEQSLNIPFARIGLEIGAERIASTAHRLGIGAHLDPVPSLALGSGEVSLLELVRAYGVFATGGSLAETRWILNWRDHNDSTWDGPRAYLREVADPAATFLVTSALRGVVLRGTGRALGAWRFKSEIAGKTGTSNNWRDAWFIAYSPDIVVGAWVGYDDGRSVRLSGSAAAVPIVAEFFKNARNLGGNSFRIPAGIERTHVYSIDNWPCAAIEYFLPGTAPPSYEAVALLVGAMADSTTTLEAPWPQETCTLDRTQH
jgi:penicillin-binding protein 1B